jgi:hypothetical protein
MIGWQIAPDLSPSGRCKKILPSFGACGRCGRPIPSGAAYLEIRVTGMTRRLRRCLVCGKAWEAAGTPKPLVTPPPSTWDRFSAATPLVAAAAQAGGATGGIARLVAAIKASIDKERERL